MQGSNTQKKFVTTIFENNYIVNIYITKINKYNT